MKKNNKKEILAKTDQLVKAELQKRKRKELYENKEWYTIRALLGNQWANWFIMAGARERSWENFFCPRLCIKLFL